MPSSYISFLKKRNFKLQTFLQTLRVPNTPSMQSPAKLFCKSFAFYLDPSSASPATIRVPVPPPDLLCKELRANAELRFAAGVHGERLVLRSEADFFHVLVEAGCEWVGDGWYEINKIRG